MRAVWLHFPLILAIFKVMPRLFFALFLATFGASLVIHLLKNFLLREKIKFRLDWDGLLERLIITYIIIAAPSLWIFAPISIVLRIVYRIFVLNKRSTLSTRGEPGVASQKVLYKSEFSLDIILSPLLALLVGVGF